MDFFITAIVFLLVFSLLVLIHEWGHFYAARKSGIKVEEFGIGMPPRIWGKKKGETIYSVNWIPFGGFVRLSGEDASDPKALKDKRSFAAKPPRLRILVVTAGVLMNLLLAYVLLTFGFIFGIQPLILSADEVLDHLDKGTIHTEDGIIVKTVEEGSPAAEAGLMPEDRILELNGKEIFSANQLDEVIDSPDQRAVIATVQRDGETQRLNMVIDFKESLGFATYEILTLPRVAIKEVEPGSQSAVAGLQSGDIILKINDRQIYFTDQYQTAVRSSSKLEYEILRNDQIIIINVAFEDTGRVVVSNVFPGTPAEESGIKKGDVILKINEQSINVPEDILNVTETAEEGKMNYKIVRDGETFDMNIKPDQNGMIGVGLSTLRSYENEQLSVYASDVPVSVIKIEDVRYPVWEAPIVAFNECVRLGVLTVDMAGNVFSSVFTRLTVPEGVAGPVGIAQLTHVFVQEGFFSIVRFVALLSLSLAIINILPFPALDGGRLLFILAEVIIGRRVGAKFEAWVHAIGFLILMLLVLAVTYSDILRFF